MLGISHSFRALQQAMGRKAATPMATMQHSSHRLVILYKVRPTPSRYRGRRTTVPTSHRQVCILWDVGRECEVACSELNGLCEKLSPGLRTRTGQLVRLHAASMQARAAAP